MDLDTVVETIKKYVDQPMMLVLCDVRPFGDNGCVGFSIKAAYEISRVFKENRRIKVIINVRRFECWDLFKEDAEKTFLDAAKEQIMDKIRGIEDILDIVIMPKGGVTL